MLRCFFFFFNSNTSALKSHRTLCVLSLSLPLSLFFFLSFLLSPQHVILLEAGDYIIVLAKFTVLRFGIPLVLFWRGKAYSCADRCLPTAPLSTPKLRKLLATHSWKKKRRRATSVCLFRRCSPHSSFLPLSLSFTFEPSQLVLHVFFLSLSPFSLVSFYPFFIVFFCYLFVLFVLCCAVLCVCVCDIDGSAIVTTKKHSASSVLWRQLSLSLSVCEAFPSFLSQYDTHTHTHRHIHTQTHTHWFHIRTCIRIQAQQRRERKKEKA